MFLSCFLLLFFYLIIYEYIICIMPLTVFITPSMYSSISPYLSNTFSYRAVRVPVFCHCVSCNTSILLLELQLKFEWGLRYYLEILVDSRLRVVEHRLNTVLL
uniref:Uncharacterized protein n=1 Tax=Cacopsylla melanoneura TaxID=428564 RepID=A0A8D8ZP74_9HEMI